jgi:arylsulfatase A-like enzyme
VRRGGWKYLRDGGYEFLYDLERDPGERDDLAAARQEMLPQFRTLLAAWEADVDAKQVSVGR